MQKSQTLRLNNTLLNNKEVTEEIRKEIKRFLETNDNENTRTENLWDSAKAVLRGRFLLYFEDTITPQEARKASKRQPDSTCKAAGKRRTKKTPKSAEDHKNQSRNKWKRNEGNNSKD